MIARIPTQCVFRETICVIYQAIKCISAYVCIARNDKPTNQPLLWLIFCALYMVSDPSITMNDDNKSNRHIECPSASSNIVKTRVTLNKV